MDGFCFKEKIEIVVRDSDGEIKDRSVVERTPGTVSKAEAERLIQEKLKEHLKDSESQYH